MENNKTCNALGIRGYPLGHIEIDEAGHFNLEQKKSLTNPEIGKPCNEAAKFASAPRCNMSLGRSSLRLNERAFAAIREALTEEWGSYIQSYRVIGNSISPIFIVKCKTVLLARIAYTLLLEVLAKRHNPDMQIDAGFIDYRKGGEGNGQEG